MKTNSICVFCSASDDIDQIYFNAAKELGLSIAEKGWSLVYGGSNLGLMGELARAAHTGGAKVKGIIPKLLHKQVPKLKAPHKLIITNELRHRKTLMESHSAAFVALPGGFGTQDELLEIITLKQLGYHNKPIVILNTRSFYKPLILFFESIFKKKFARTKHRELYHVCPDAKAAVKYLKRLGI